MIELSEEQRRELTAQGMPRAIDPKTQKTYILIEAEVYERLQRLLGFLDVDDGPDMHQVAQLVERAMQEEDQDDPSLEYYQQKYGKDA